MCERSPYDLRKIAVSPTGPVSGITPPRWPKKKAGRALLDPLLLPRMGHTEVACRMTWSIRPIALGGVTDDSRGRMLPHRVSRQHVPSRRRASSRTTCVQFASGSPTVALASDRLPTGPRAGEADVAGTNRARKNKAEFRA